ncbi:MAG TPA: triphosphoribosyl-dephospho-CoA synthase MdcB [Oxalicibacterium sp.]|nr:triphosphoribosyl-dephospho-CoA synthase MdcB [Oxalicibacterium sp.]
MERNDPLLSSFAGRADGVPLHASSLQCIRHTDIALLAIRSLHAELVLYPKPGLVSPWDNGSHDDMDAALFMRSLFSLRHYFARMARAGAEAAPFAVLRHHGIEAEHTMLAATRGINTHRGAIFALGLLCAAAGYCRQHGRPFSTTMLRHALTTQWGAALVAHSAAPMYGSHGQHAAMRFAVGGAREEAAAGFPSLFDVALPQLRRSLASGRTVEEAQIDAFFSLMAHIDDTNIYTRGGVEGAALMRGCAQQFLSRGGTAHPDWRAAARDYHRQFVAKRLSPGGAADLFAATWFVHQLAQAEQAEQAAQASVIGDNDG